MLKNHKFIKFYAAKPLQVFANESFFSLREKVRMRNNLSHKKTPTVVEAFYLKIKA